jgi:hypothetical protein
MLSHRFQDFWSQSEPETYVPATMAMGAAVAFVACPCSVVQSMSSFQQTQIEHLYRLAYEQAQAQVSQARRIRRFEFSVN